jgi:4-hydroxy-tetrahydrodipicolinate synthase
MASPERRDATANGSRASEFDGVWTAIATPFTPDQEIDWPAYERLLKLQDAGGVRGLVISGTTGESPTLGVQEKLALIRKARAFLPPTIRIMAGTGDNNTRQSVELSKLAQDAGADSLLVVTPPYNKPSTAGLVLHYKTIADAVRLPICLYHVPGRTGQLLTVDQIETVCREAGVKTVKEATGDVAFFSRALTRAKVPFLSGDDPTYLASLAVGGRGVISVVSNLHPRPMVELTEAARAGDLSRARALHEALMPTIDALFYESSPGPLKAAMAAMGLSHGTLRPPLAPITEATRKRLEDALAQTKAALADLVPA